MQNFQFEKLHQAKDAVSKAGGEGVKYLAGGTNLIDMMKLGAENPRVLLDINSLPLKEVKASHGGLRVGALVTNTDLAHHPEVEKHFPVLSQAILAGASAQLRNKATTAGNLLQRTRCVYFRDTAHACNKRKPGSGCPAIEGHNRNMAVLGTSESCIATNPSDMNVAMMALEAKISVQGPKGEREIPIEEFYLLPGHTPEKEVTLNPGELITGVELAALPSGAKSYYLKLRDRASYEFALASAAVVVAVKAGKIEHARVALGGVGTRPWRAKNAEKILEGGPVSEERFRLAAAAALEGAKPYKQNGFKIELARRCLVQALKTVTEA